MHQLLLGSVSRLVGLPWLPKAHRVSCQALKGTKRMLWLMWLWASVTWEGCGVPWNKVSALCGHSHSTTTQQHLISYKKWRPAFLAL